MKISIIDRLLAVLCYCTFSIFSIVLLVYFNLIKCRISDFLLFNILQSIFVWLAVATISAVYNFLFNIFMEIPLECLFFLKNIAGKFDLILNHTPVIFSFTITGFVVFLILAYLSIMAAMSKKPYFPYVSSIIDYNMGKR